MVAAWQAAHPGGEVVQFTQAPAPSRLVQELASPSLFAPERLLLVIDARPYLEPDAGADTAGLAASLEALSLTDVTLVLTAVAATSPTGPLVDALGRRGEVRFLGLPQAPRPWDHARVSPDQRRALAGVIARVAPALAAQEDVVDALCERYGFHPRELAHAAERLALSGEATAAAVRAEGGAGECPLRELEEALQHRDARRFARFIGALAAGAVLTDWRGGAVAPDGYGPVLSNAAGRLLRQGLAMRTHAVRAGLGAELEPGRCAGDNWYPRTFKPRLHPRLAAEIERTPDSPLAGMTPWQLHHSFRLAATYGERELIAALAGLASARPERARRDAALAALSAPLLTLLAGAPAARTTPGA